MKKTIQFVLCLLLVSFFPGCVVQNSKNVPHDIRPVQEYIYKKFEEHLKSISVSYFNITDAAYKYRAGNHNQYVCSLKADIVYQDNTTGVVEYGYLVKVSDRNELIIEQEGPDIIDNLLSTT